jgi:hypothetical protein
MFNRLNRFRTVLFPPLAGTQARAALSPRLSAVSTLNFQTFRDKPVLAAGSIKQPVFANGAPSSGI